MDTPTKFYTFNQNNSGGSFVTNKNVSHYVIVEATSANEANSRAKDVGLYFDGCASGEDCDCCGDRWYEVDDGYAYDVPCIYGTPVHEYENIWSKYMDDDVRIHYLDGRVEAISTTPKKVSA